MATSESSVEAYEATGDPEHAAYGQDFYWTCACGASANFFTGESKARNRAEHHEQNCDETATVRVNK